MGAISFSYNVKPKVIDALKEDMPLPIVDFNIDKLKTYPGCDDWQYCVYAAGKYKNEVVCIIGLIKYDNFNKECYVKVYDETCGPIMTNISKSLRNRLKENFYFAIPEITNKSCSHDGSIKYLLKLQDGSMIESIWMPSDK